MYDYTLFPNNSSDKFKAACEKLTRSFPKAEKQKLLIDVDGTTIQTFTVDGKDIDVYDDYDIGAVFIKSQINLDYLFNV